MLLISETAKTTSIPCNHVLFVLGGTSRKSAANAGRSNAAPDCGGSRSALARPTTPASADFDHATENGGPGNVQNSKQSYKAGEGPNLGLYGGVKRKPLSQTR